MNIALIGYGRMGHEIEAIAINRGHVIKLIVDQDNTDDLNRNNLKGIDAVIEFSSPATALSNIITCLGCKVPVVSGTTGWLENYDKVVSACVLNKTSFIHSANFSIGVNLIFRLNRELAKQMERYTDYAVSVEEIHHTKKLDAPSGTAIALVKGIMDENKRYTSWSMDEEKAEAEAEAEAEGSIPVTSHREGEVPGTHIVTWESGIDTIILKHEARNRKGFALGAVVAAEFIHSREGVYTMDDVMGF